MRRVVLALCLSLVAAAAYSQNPENVVRELRRQAADALVTVEYSFVSSAAGTEVADEGIVEAQDDMWHLKGSRIEIYTSGDATWILDNDAKEALIEPAWTYEDLAGFYNSSKTSGMNPEITVSSTVLFPKKPSEYFRPVLDDEWIVTDLR